MATKLEHYRIFCQVAKQLSFSKAAQSLYLSQPAVSQSIRQMEEQLGVQLFLRSARRVALTGQGKFLYEYASSALGLLQSAEKQISGLHDLAAGELRIGAGDITTKHLLLPYLETFHTRYPLVHLSIFNRTSAESLELLHAGRLDVAFLNLPIDDDKIIIHREFPIQDIFVAGNRFAALREKTLTLRELAAQPLILLERKANSRVYVERFFLRQGIELAPEIELASCDLLLEFAKINLGIACVAEEFSQKELAEGSVFQLRLATPPAKRSIGIACLKGVSVPMTVTRLLEITS